MLPIEREEPQLSNLPLPSAALVLDVRGLNDSLLDMLKTEIENLASEMDMENIYHWRYLTKFLAFKSLEPLTPNQIKHLRSLSKPPAQPQPPSVAGPTTQAPTPPPTGQAMQSQPPSVGGATTQAQTPPPTGQVSQTQPPVGGPTTQTQTPPTSDQAAQTPPPTGQAAQTQPPVGQNGTTTSQAPSNNKTILGFAGRLDNMGIFPSRIFHGPGQAPPSQEINDEFQRSVQQCIEEIKIVRNQRIMATADFDPRGRVGRNTQDPTVYVILLANAEDPDSVASASAYAHFLKDYHRQHLEHIGHPPVISISIICLDHDNHATPPTHLINSLRWEHNGDEWGHINSLIISEKYREDAGWVPSTLQADIAELLLYALLIIPPPTVRPEAPDQFEHFPTPANAKERRNLPPNTFVIGLSAVEYSVRWGRRLLSYGLAGLVGETLLDDTQQDDPVWTSTVVETWLTDWRDSIARALPNAIPGNTAVHAAFARSSAVAEPPDPIFSSSSTTVRIIETTRRDLQNYIDSIAQTYTRTVGQRDALQDALDSVPLIQQSLSTRSDDTPLTQARQAAQGALSSKPLFLGPRGALPRAKRQFQEMTQAIGALQQNHAQTSLDLKQRRVAFEQAGADKITDLQATIDTFPLVSSMSGFKRPIAWLTLLLATLLSAFAIVFSFAWFHHLGFVLFPSIMQGLDRTLFVSSIFTYILFIILIAAVLTILLGPGRRIVNGQHTPLAVELRFLITLLCFAIVGLIVGISLNPLAPVFDQDPNSYALLQDLSALPFCSIIVFLLIIGLLTIEAIYFFQWRQRLVEERERIVEELRQLHEQTVDGLRRFIADALALHFLKQAELTDGKGGYGLYYHRLERLSKSLALASRQAQVQHTLSINRLTHGNQSTTQQIETPTLIFRDELLDMRALMTNYQSLKNGLTRQGEALDEMAQMLLYVMGEEKPESIEQQARTNVVTHSTLTPRKREDRFAQILLALAASVTLRVTAEESATYDVAPLAKRYNELDYQATQYCGRLKPLIDRLEEVVGTISSNQQPLAEAERTDLIAQALADWSQTLWEHQPPLDEMLQTSGVIDKLVREGHNSQTLQSRLNILANLMGHSAFPQHPVELYLLVYPSLRSSHFLDDTSLKQYATAFPDVERLIWLYIQHYVALPYVIEEEPPSPPQIGAASIQ